MTIKDLKQSLINMLNDLNKYSDSAEVTTYNNTYFIKSNCFVALPGGFIDLKHPIE